MATGSSLFTAERIFPVFLLNVFAKNEKTDLSQTERRPKPLCSVYRRQRSHDPGMGARTRRAFGSREGLPHGDWPRAGCRAPSAGAFCVQRQSWHRASVRTSVRGVRRTVRDRARVNDSSRLTAMGRRPYRTDLKSKVCASLTYFRTRTTFVTRLEIVSSACGPSIVSNDGCAARLRLVS